MSCLSKRNKRVLFAGIQRGYKAVYDIAILGPMVDRLSASLATVFTFFTGTVAAPGMVSHVFLTRLSSLLVYLFILYKRL